MGLFTKILLLIIAQIVVIIGCLAIHLDDFEPSSTPIETTELKQLTLLEKLKSYIKEDEPTAKEITPTIEEKEVVETKSIAAVTPIEPSEKEDKPAKKEQKSEIALPKVIKSDVILNKPLAKIEIQEEKQIETKKEIKKELTQPIVQDKKIQTTLITDKKVKALFEKKKLENTSKKESEDVPATDAAVIESKTNEEIEKEISQIVSKNGIIFKRLSTEVTTKSIETIKKVAEVLKSYPSINIEVGGHTDAKGDDEVNAYVSKHRALSVKKILVKFGIDENRLRAKGYGESMPIVKNDPRGYSIKNRRVEFKIVKE